MPRPASAPRSTGPTRLEGADLVIDNSGDHAHLQAEVDRVWAPCSCGRPQPGRRRSRASANPAGAEPGSCHTLPVPSDVCPTSRSSHPSAPPATSPRPSPAWSPGLEPRRPVPDAAGHHRIGQDGHHRLDHRGRPATHPDHRAQQVAGRPAGRRAEGVLPPQPGRVLRLLLRLLPARGVRALVGHLHREGLVHQRRDRPPPPRLHLVAAAAAGHHRGGVGVVHLRAGLPRRVPRPDRRPAPRRGARPAGPAPAAGRAPVLAQRRQPCPGASSGPGATPSRSTPPTRARPSASSSSATRSSASGPSTSSPARSVTSSRSWSSSPTPTTAPATSACARPWMSIETELRERLTELEGAGKLLEAQRLRMRTEYDLEMLAETGVCSGVENYSRHLDGRAPGEAPFTLLDFFPKDFLVVLDESHVAVPQLRGQYAGDRSRKETLVDHGFRLPSAMDNRPLRFEEFIERTGQTILLSATPGPWELEHSANVVEQVIRPTGLVDPEVDIRPDHRADRRPAGADRRHRGRRQPGAGHHPDQEDGRGPDRLPGRAGGPGPVPALRRGHHGPHRDPPRAAAGRVRRPGRHQPPPRGPRPARGGPGGHPRRRQGGLPALGLVAHPDHGPGGPQRQRSGGHVRRHHHRLDDQRPSARPSGAGPARSPTTRPTASTPGPSPSR